LLRDMAGLSVLPRGSVVLPRFTWPINFESAKVYRQHWVQFLCVFTFLTLLSGATAQTTNNLRCFTGTYDGVSDLFPVKTTVVRAVSFTVEYRGNYKLVKHTVTNETYVLYQCGTPKPVGNFPSNTQYFQIPVSRVIVQDTTSVTFLESFGAGGAVIAVNTDYDVLPTSPCMLKGLQQGTIKSTKVLNYTNSDAQVDFGQNSIGGPVDAIGVANFVSIEPNVLARSEGAKYYGLFFNAEHVTNAFYDYTVNNYMCWKSSVSTTATRPVLAFIYFYNGAYTVAHGGFKPSLVADAGAQLATFNASSFSNLTSLVAAMDAANVSILIDETYFFSGFPTLAQVLSSYGLDSSNASTAYRWSNNIYREDGQVNSNYQYDWFDGGQVFAGAVLNDFMNVVNSSLPTPSYKRFFIRNIYTESPKVYDPNSCTGSYRIPTASPAATCPGLTYPTVLTQEFNPIGNAASSLLVSAAVLLIVALLA